MTPEQQWLELLRDEQSKAFDTLRLLARMIVCDAPTGYVTAKDVAKRIMQMDDQIASTVGDCPE